MAWQTVSIPATEEPKKLENFLKKRYPIGYVRKLFRKKGVRLNGRRAGPEAMARPGDRLELFIPFEKRAAVEKIAWRDGFEIIYEEQDLLVVNKKAAIAVHEGKEVPKRRSLLGMLEEIYRPQGIIPRLVHRIDRETSGLLLVAKNAAVAKELEKLFESGDIDKEYLALVLGHLSPKRGEIDLPLLGREGRPVRALTVYQVEREFSATTLVRVTTETGRMHQIRIHFAKLGHPVVMDDEHGNFAFNKEFRKAHGLRRQFLHARGITLTYKGKRRRWIARLPDDLKLALESLSK